MKHWMMVCLAAIVFPSCSSDENVNLGEDDPATLGSKLEDYTALWQGYAEAHQFLSGSDRVRLRIDESGDGYALFGEGTAPPPATNPDVGYPEGIDYMQLVTTVGHFKEGVHYPLHDVIVEDRRIRFWVNKNDFWQDWCRLQTPAIRLDSVGGDPFYDVSRYNTWSQSGGTCYGLEDAAPPVELDCNKLALQREAVCSCTAEGCEPNPHTNRVDFDAALQSGGEELVGTLTVGSRVTVRLTRE